MSACVTLVYFCGKNANTRLLGSESGEITPFGDVH